jgi:hypothetical protein
MGVHQSTPPFVNLDDAPLRLVITFVKLAVEISRFHTSFTNEE